MVQHSRRQRPVLQRKAAGEVSSRLLQPHRHRRGASHSCKHLHACPRPFSGSQGAGRDGDRRPRRQAKPGLGVQEHRLRDDHQTGHRGGLAVPHPGAHPSRQHRPCGSTRRRLVGARVRLGHRALPGGHRRQACRVCLGQKDRRLSPPHRHRAEISGAVRG